VAMAGEKPLPRSSPNYNGTGWKLFVLWLHGFTPGTILGKV